MNIFSYLVWYEKLSEVCQVNFISNTVFERKKLLNPLRSLHYYNDVIEIFLVYFI